MSRASRKGKLAWWLGWRWGRGQVPGAAPLCRTRQLLCRLRSGWTGVELLDGGLSCGVAGADLAAEGGDQVALLLDVGVDAGEGVLFCGR
jgi:hypothetical protein